MHYYPPVTDGLLPWQYYASLPFLLLFIAVIAWVVIRRRPLWKDVLFGVSFFVVTIAVMEQIIAVGPSLTPERYTYIPYIGLFYIIGQWLANIVAGKQKIPAILFTVFIIMCCVQTWARIGDWQNSDTLFNDVVQKNEDATGTFEFYFLRGDRNAYEGKFPEALQDYNQSIALNPGYAEAYTNRGVVYFQTGDMRSALLDYNMAIKLKPGRAKPYENRAGLEATSGDFKAALDDYDHFLKLDSTDSKAYTDRGMVRMSLKDTTGACKDWQKALSLGNKDASGLVSQFCR